MPCKFKYDLVAEISTDGNAKVSKYKSTNSGISLCIAQINGPLVAGYFPLATEAFDDDGLPHTLEHLVFRGSEKYPFQGFLDLIASRCLSQGTNAWTDTDHTCYTVTTAGYEGFLNLLPIYLDYLLFPTLTESDFMTEVHHINGDGEDAGVVYCEMQGRENSGDSRCHLAMLRAMYPGHCGYKSETGGLLKNLRESTTNEKVRAYHKAFYRPENLCLIIIGMIDPEKVFEALTPVEERILQEVERTKFIRPWQIPVPPLLDSVVLQIEYPTDEDEYGLVLAAWRGPMANDFTDMIAMQVLLDYLTNTSVAPLNLEFIEIDEPLCNEVAYSIIENSETCVYMHFSSVPVSRQTELKEKLCVLLKKIADGEVGIDMQRMTTLIKKKKLYNLSSMEDNPHDALASCLIADFLYGSTIEDLDNRLKEIPLIEKLLEKDVQFWCSLLKKYLVDGKHVIVLGTPSTDLSEKMQAEEKQRIQDQRERLGPDGLKKAAELLKKAVDDGVPASKELLTSISVPSVNSIKFHPIKRKSNVRESEGDVLPYSISKMPCRFQLDVIQTNFVRLFVMIDTSDLPLASRMYLPLLIELLDECAINRNGEVVPYEEIVKQLAEDTVSIHAAIGFGYRRFFCSKYSQMVCLQMTVEEEKYEKSIQWVREILYQLCIEPSRIKCTAKKMITDVPSIKESGSCVVKSMLENLLYRPESNHWSASVFRQNTFLKKLLKELETNPNTVIKELNNIIEHLAKPEKMVVHLALNLENMKKKLVPEEPWIKSFLPAVVAPAVMSCNFKKCSEYLQPFALDSIRGLIAGLGSIESSFLLLASACPISRNHPDYAPLFLLNNYLSMTEGPMWVLIRGNGLAYSYGIYNDPDLNLLYFSLFKSSHLVKAYKESLELVDSHLNGTTKWDMVLLDNAKASLISQLIEKVQTVTDVVSQSVITYCRGSNLDFNTEMIESINKISKVTTSDMERVGNQYLRPLFDPNLSKCTITCNPSKVKEIVEEFKQFSRDLTIVPSLDDSFMSKY